jgi:hypothetical protein
LSPARQTNTSSPPPPLLSPLPFPICLHECARQS